MRWRSRRTVSLQAAIDYLLAKQGDAPLTMLAGTVEDSRKVN
ncbi:hypothetical protein EM595_0752 [Duffyella gerundensis]|uniref:Uncharacterized protein n=1 Tax=Duffyella gerundensis TaxID=1619313 RepID=A0A0U5LKY8_9GAMM|nr:hypothetical protein EM595_0752 [Duffyella gerundensis]